MPSSRAPDGIGRILRHGYDAQEGRGEMSTLELSPGNTLLYQHVPPEHANGATFVFFNALSGSLAMWTDTVTQALYAAGHGTLLYNMRGQEGSDFTAPSALAHPAIVADAVALLTTVKPVNPIYVGLSIGGLFAIGAHLAGVPAVAIATINTLRKPGIRLDWINAAVARAAAQGGSALLMDLYAPMLFAEPWLAQNIKTALNPENYVPADQSSGAFGLLSQGASADWNVPWHDVAVPVTVITGLQDRVFYVEPDVADIVAQMSLAKRVDVADAGHMVPLERADAVSDALLQLAREAR